VAELLFYRKNVESGGDIVEMKIWRVTYSKDRPHGLRYSLVYVREGKRLVGYDNAEGKGDHRHHRGKEQPYRFRDINTLIEDYFRDVEQLRRGEL
jgi:hypothetical protein